MRDTDRFSTSLDRLAAGDTRGAGIGLNLAGPIEPRPALTAERGFRSGFTNQPFYYFDELAGIWRDTITDFPWQRQTHDDAQSD